MLEKNSINPKTISEVGCGAGEILNQLYNVLPNDAHFTGYEIASDAMALAKTREKERLHFKLENLQGKKVKFDLLLMMDVFEHVSDYLGVLKICKQKSTFTIFYILLDVSVQSVMRNKLI
jgi:2-polyprenyl-3-methyl-5-hydroxy-6-metoxy-1,4-benzoquinol methylase